MHSLTGLWLSIFLIEHLLTNSQAALWIGDDGSGFVRAVNFLKNLPYLQVIEVVLLGIPILIHMIWGIQYLRTSTPNAWSSDGSTTSLPYKRNKAYSWQRITSWILLIGLIGHIVHMRFIEYPSHAERGSQKNYMVRLDLDAGLIPLAERLDVQLYDSNKIQVYKETLENEGIDLKPEEATFVQSLRGIFTKPTTKDPNTLLMNQKQEQEQEWLKAVESRPLSEGQVVAVTKDFGTAELLVVRETFKWPFMMALYTIFVLAAVYHGYNGMWTFLITWGFTLTPRSQDLSRKFTNLLMLAIGFMGLIAIWGSYWINLKT